MLILMMAFTLVTLNNQKCQQLPWDWLIEGKVTTQPLKVKRVGRGKKSLLKMDLGKWCPCTAVHQHSTTHGSPAPKTLSSWLTDTVAENLSHSSELEMCYPIGEQTEMLTLKWDNDRLLYCWWLLAVVSSQRGEIISAGI